MRSRFRHVWESIHSSYWFVPGLMAIAALGLSLLTLRLDRTLKSETLEAVRLIYLSQPEGARALLSTVAGSMITVAGVTFSIVIVVLSLASQQFGPRLLRNFMRDTANQLVLGTFVATFLYCLMVLRAVRSEDDGGGTALFVPQLSLTVALAITIVNLGVFIFFIHHIAESIQVETMLKHVSNQLRRRLESNAHEAVAFPDRKGGAGLEPAPFPADSSPLLARRSGYLQAIYEKGLIHLARERDVVVRLRVRPGDFLMEGLPLADVATRSGEPSGDGELAEAFDEHLSLGPHRTPEQDVAFLFEQLLEIGLRALSPSVNDPLTAMHAIDRITEHLRQLDRRDPPPQGRADDDGELRVIVPPLDEAALARRLLGALRTYGADHPLVARRLLERLHQLHDGARSEGLAAVCVEEAERLVDAARGAMQPADARDLAEEQRRLFGT